MTINKQMTQNNSNWRVQTAVYASKAGAEKHTDLTNIYTHARTAYAVYLTNFNWISFYRRRYHFFAVDLLLHIVYSSRFLCICYCFEPIFSPIRSLARYYQLPLIVPIELYIALYIHELDN